TGQVRLTLVVDPETIQALRTMTKEYRVGTAARSVPGTGQRVAAAWLARLRSIAPAHLVVAVAYGDPDTVALERGGIAALGQPERADGGAVGDVPGRAPAGGAALPRGAGDDHRRAARGRPDAGGRAASTLVAGAGLRRRGARGHRPAVLAHRGQRGHRRRHHDAG